MGPPTTALGPDLKDGLVSSACAEVSPQGLTADLSHPDALTQVREQGCLRPEIKPGHLSTDEAVKTHTKLAAQLSCLPAYF